MSYKKKVVSDMFSCNGIAYGERSSLWGSHFLAHRCVFVRVRPPQRRSIPGVVWCVGYKLRVQCHVNTCIDSSSGNQGLFCWLVGVCGLRLCVEFTILVCLDPEEFVDWKFG